MGKLEFQTKERVMEKLVECRSTRRRMRKGAFVVVLGLLISVGVLVSSASATIMKHVDLPRLVEISDIIVHGQVAEQRTYFDEEQERVVTDVTVEVDRNYYGADGKTVVFQQWRGEHDGQFHSIPGDANFEDGEEVVVFLHRGDDDVVALSALGQSKFQVVRNGDQNIVTRDLRDIGFLLDKPDGSTEIGHKPNETRGLESFSAELESLVAGIKGGAQ
ncbi:MAG: hypothetical protein ACQEVA_02835 [Myxococcota bacterium]